MNERTLSIGSTITLPKPELDLLMTDLHQRGYKTVGPVLRDESIVYSDLDEMRELPRGILTEQSPASYRLIQTNKERYFDFIPGSQSWKQFLFPPRETLFTGMKGETWHLEENDEPALHYALIGVRACELAAIHVQDKVFMRDDFTDPKYRSIRENLFILAVNCLHPNATCFCRSMGTGPKHSSDFDLCLTELEDTFLVQIGSDLGRSLLEGKRFDLASAFAQNQANEAMDQAAASIVRTLDTSDLAGLFTTALESNRWSEVAKRCLSCANCTQVCPTCFCWDVTDQMDLLGKSTRRERIWDSCFNPNYSYVVGGNTRPNIRSRYRQWLTHKLGTWSKQFGVQGCVGCGRCISWCPAGIDLTEEVAAIRAEVKE